MDDFRGGKKIRVKGAISDGVLEATSLTVLGPSDTSLQNEPAKDKSNVTGDSQMDAPTTLHRRALVVSVALTDGTPRDTTLLRELFFTAMDSIENYFKDALIDTITFKGPEGQMDVAGPIAIDVSNADCGSKYVQLMNDTDTKLIAQGYNLSLYRHIVYFVPSTCITSGWQGIAGVGGKYAVLKSLKKGFVAHELGHNLGLMHASTDPENDGVINSEYGDRSCIQGNSGLLSYLNAPHTVKTGIFKSIPNKVQAALPGQNYILPSLSLKPTEVASAQILTFPGGGDVPRGDYYISYRSKIRFDSDLTSSYLGGLSIHRWMGSSNNSKLIQVLKPGEVFLDEASLLKIKGGEISSDGNSMAVTFEDIGSLPNNEIQVTVIGSGGRVRFNNPSQVCPNNCSAIYNSTVEVLLYAEVVTGHTFEGWSGACSGKTPFCTLLTNESKNVTAQFKATGDTNQYLTVNVSGNGSVNISKPVSVCKDSCVNGYSAGESVTLTAVPDQGYLFDGWTSPSNSCSGQNPVCVVTMNSSQSVNAVFKIDDSGETSFASSAPLNKPSIGCGMVSKISDDDDQGPPFALITLLMLFPAALALGMRSFNLPFSSEPEVL